MDSVTEAVTLSAAIGKPEWARGRPDGRVQERATHTGFRALLRASAPSPAGGPAGSSGGGRAAPIAAA